MQRTSGKNNSDFGILDIYKFYKQEQKGKNKPIVGLKEFRKIIKYHNTEVCRTIVEDTEEFRMPYRLGYLRIRKFKQRLKLDANGKLDTSNMYADWKATNKLWDENPQAKEAKKIIWHTK